jgi:hypothetical protein
LQSNHDRSPLASITLAAGGVGILVAFAAALEYVAGTRGFLAAVLLAGAVSGGCRLLHSLQPRRVPGLTRPAPVRLPDRARDVPEPARNAA